MTCFYPTNQNTLYLQHLFYSDNEIITVCGRPAIWTLIGWFKSSRLFISLFGFCGSSYFNFPWEINISEMIYAALSIFEGEKFPMSKTSSEYKNALKVILKLVEGKLNYIHLSISRVFGKKDKQNLAQT